MFVMKTERSVELSMKWIDFSCFISHYKRRRELSTSARRCQNERDSTERYFHVPTLSPINN